jgi:hypothetical protein
MAACDKIFAVNLKENDESWAKFRSSDIAEHSNVELKRWLRCQDLNLSVKRQELIDR